VNTQFDPLDSPLFWIVLWVLFTAFCAVHYLWKKWFEREP